MKRIFIITFLTIVVALGFSSCSIQQRMHMRQFNSIEIKNAPKEHFDNLKHGTEIVVSPTQPRRSHNWYTYHMSGKAFYTEPTINYIRSMGFVEMSSSEDYKLTITIIKADANGFWGSSNVNLEVNLYDDRGNEVYKQKDIIGKGKSQFTALHFGLDKAYTRALEQVNWGKIASYLNEAKSSKDEQNKTVNGNGDTALEQNIIRWDVQSRPQGADIFWRVVSKTPEVKSTNNKYLQTTPYEATKALDIKGLTYENSSNVRIILRCEKDGYLSQEKEYDVRMIMDQEEISAFFRLVKEE